ncbi:DNA translocase FtsK [Halobacillus salinarum]|uniref:DNA translocase FtsK n=1 Tax=Halobacillus salinarum TaxID=2932257 RepID=A0ABY4ER23_9BACI|nr:DNA translocase FtsK [Halobacillus salinarum]UOQ46430.1 DNA translocase FtsK [Halobacillus salinarum]
MWKDLFNKFKDMFEDEYREQSYQKQKRRKQTYENHESNANTKMTYKYPKSGEFRFPVIPDHRVQKPRAARTNQVPPVKPEKKEESYPRYKPEQPEKKRSDKKVEKKTSEEPVKSFTPTDVPSPIYGYHSREQQQRKDSPKVTRMVENDITFSHDEKEWQAFRQRLRGTVDTVRDTSVSHELGREEAASLETEPEVETAERKHNQGFNSQEENSDLSLLSYEEEDKASEYSGGERELPDSDTNSRQLDEVTEEELEPLHEEPFSQMAKQEAPLDAEEQFEEEEAGIDDPEVFNEELYVESEPSAAPREEGEGDVEKTYASEELTIEERPEPAAGDDESLKIEEVESSKAAESEELFEKHEPLINGQTEEQEAEKESGQTSVLKADTMEDRSESARENVKPLEVEKPRKSSNKNARSHVPFNVIMTPRDKRTRDQQNKEYKSNVAPLQRKTEMQSEEPAETAEPLYERVEYNTPIHLLEDPVSHSYEDEHWVKEQMEQLETTLRHFHVRAKVTNAMKGPSVTRFEVQPEPGVKVSKITNLADDIKLSMAAKDIRIEAPIPGKQAVGIEVPNQQSQMVGLQEIFESQAFIEEKSPLTVGLGLDIGGDPVVTNLKKMPHGLIAGATGSGKSVCINTILISMLYKAHHEDVKFLLIDPKMVELAPYNDIPHLVSPVITDVKAATTALKWAVKEMEERYEKFVEEGVRDVERYNDKMIRQSRQSEKLPYLVIVIDELADLMMVSPQDVEDAICRIAQKARACGIHLLLATQRPSVDVITGLIKANIPTRVAFSVSSQVDSRTIIDSGGAEKLLGKGDMLFVENGSGLARRIQGAFVSDDEIERVTNYVKKVAPPQYLFEQEELMKQVHTEEETDELFNEAVQFVVAQNGASASLLQRRFKVGYNRAARLIDQMEEFGIISEPKGSKPRDILLNQKQIDEMMGSGA